MGDRATEVALFRYALIREAADPAIDGYTWSAGARVGRRDEHRSGRCRGARWALDRQSVDPGLAGRLVRGAQAQAAGAVVEGAASSRSL